jgi:hypothetical protein
MKASDLIRELSKVDPETEVVLWEWDGKKGESDFWLLNPTCNPTQPKGRYCLTANGGRFAEEN